MHRISLISIGLLASLAFSGCAQDSESADLGTGLRSLSAVSDGNVKGFEYFITACDVDPSPHVPGTGHFEPLRNQTLPGALIDVLDDPFADDSNHRFSDYFKTLAAGCYRVTAVPVHGEEGIFAPYTLCTSATREVEVHEGATTEVVLISQCLGTDPGALDAVSALNHDPEIAEVWFPDSKFSCGETIKICAQASDPDGDPLDYQVTFNEGDDCVGGPFESEGDAMCAKVYCNQGGSYKPVVKVYDVSTIDAKDEHDPGRNHRIEDLLSLYGAPEGTTSHAELQVIVHIDNCPAPVGCVADLFGGSRYLLCDDASNWKSARDKCRGYEPGMDLAAIGSAGENEFLNGKVGGSVHWVGGYNDFWPWTPLSWSNGEAVTYTNWGPGEPNNAWNGSIRRPEFEDCVHLGWFGAGDGRWNDFWCSAKAKYVCEVR
jgi:hypothetical protein